jgi:hypothetical protein
MATQHTTRLNLAYPDETVSNDVPVHLGAFLVPLDLIATVFLQGLQSAIPAAGTVGRVYDTTDWLTNHPTSRFQWDTGSAWVDVAAPQPVVIPFFVPGAFTAGARTARWIAPEGGKITRLRAYLAGGATGSNCTVNILVNGTPTQTSGSIPIGAVTLFDFTDVTFAAGDLIQLNVQSQGGSPADLSVTVAGVFSGVAT